MYTIWYLIGFVKIIILVKNSALQTVENVWCLWLRHYRVVIKPHCLVLLTLKNSIAKKRFVHIFYCKIIVNRLVNIVENCSGFHRKHYVCLMISISLQTLYKPLAVNTLQIIRILKMIISKLKSFMLLNRRKYYWKRVGIKQSKSVTKKNPSVQLNVLIDYNVDMHVCLIVIRIMTRHTKK